ncbi:hypothetical protein GA0115246_104712 [Streptomyces sp. SolWspMP-sol7th]|nr:hypothetical protein GA0115246_104712 [Streptomyces sp. SolWspMP-sol7th]
MSRHSATSFAYRATPRAWSGSPGRVHSSWFPGAHTTRAKRSARRRSAQSMSARRSPMSPATMSQSSGWEGRIPSVRARFSSYEMCRSLTARSVLPVAVTRRA